MTDHLITASAEQGPIDAEPPTKDKHSHCMARNLQSRKYLGIDNPDFAKWRSSAGDSMLVYQCQLLVYIMLYPLQVPDNVFPPFFIYSQDGNLRHTYLGVSPTEQNRIYFLLNKYWNELWIDLKK